MKFSQGTIESLQSYVYVLLDPRDAKIFYVGKGIGSRVFDHVRRALNDVEAKSLKYDTIREIEATKLSVEHFIIRHGMDEKSAFEVEAALIDALSLQGLTNIALGHGSELFGIRRAGDIEALYSVDALDTDQSVILININRLFNRTMSDHQVYEATRASWVVGPRRENAKYVVATYRGITRAVYEVDHWYPVSDGASARWAFVKKTSKISDDVLANLMNKSVRALFSKGAANPIRYVNC